MNCSHVYEIVQGKDYRYCTEPGAVTVAGNSFCFAHGTNLMLVEDFE